MKSVVLQFIIAALLFAGGAAVWAEAKVARRVADALSTVRDVALRRRRPHRRRSLRARSPAVADRHDSHRRPAAPRDRVVLAQRVTAPSRRPWRRRTAAGRRGSGDDAHPGQRRLPHQPRPPRRDAPILERLDGIINAYADVLRTDAGRADASYNYEYVVRFRDRLAKMRPRDRVDAGDSQGRARNHERRLAVRTDHLRPAWRAASGDSRQPVQDARADALR